MAVITWYIWIVVYSTVEPLYKGHNHTSKIGDKIYLFFLERFPLKVFFCYLEWCPLCPNLRGSTIEKLDDNFTCVYTNSRFGVHSCILSDSILTISQAFFSNYYLLDVTNLEACLVTLKVEVCLCSQY